MIKQSSFPESHKTDQNSFLLFSAFFHIFNCYSFFREESAKVCRSVEDPINLPDVTEFPGMARKIQKFVNKSTDLPDIQDYTDLIKAYSEKNNSKITSKQIEAFSKKYVRIVTDLWRRRRLKDFQEDLFLVEHEVPDDAELIQKLKQNDKDQKSIESVLEVKMRHF